MAEREKLSIQKAIHTGTIKIGDLEIPCYVTDEGERVLSGRGMQEALRLVDEEAPASGQKPGSRMDRLLGQKSLKPLLYKHKPLDHFDPIKIKHSGKSINGFRAQVLADICEAMLEARDQGLCDSPRRQTIAKQCEILLRGFARVGIIALVDEATGYQEAREKQALAAIFDAYLRKELAAWTKRFPPEFYKEIFRLRGWVWNPSSVKRPSVIAKYTNDLVYERLAPGILDELQRLNPKDDKGRRKHKHHQWLTEDIGHPALTQQIHTLMAFMRASTTWDRFYRAVQRSLPKKNEAIQLMLIDMDELGQP